MDNYYCEVCDIRCSGVEPFVQHMKSNKHKKKEEQKELLKNIDSVEKNFFCITCGISCSGIVPYQQHMKSEKHLKKDQAKQLSEYSISSSETVDGEGNVTPVYTPNDFRCSPCDKQFTGIVPYEQHINSTVHKKKQQKIDLQSALESGELGIPRSNVPVEKKTCSSSSVQDASNLEDNSVCMETLFRCDLCEKDFASQATRDLHLLSSAHASEKEAFSSEDGYSCAVCNKRFTGSIPFGQHMSSFVHQKNVKKAELLSSMSGQKISEATSNSNDMKSIVQNTTVKSADSSSVSVLALAKLHNIGSTESSRVLAECYVCSVKFYRE